MLTDLLILMRHLAILPCLVASLLAETEELPPGHSHQGHSFNEGPRQAGELMGDTGNVTMPIETTWDQGQAYFDQGLGQLHGFWYYEAERSFRQIAAHDPDCAMAYWGMAMANWENVERAKGFIEKASALAKKASPSAQAYIAAQANYLDGEPKDELARRKELLRDLENLIHDFPEDIEAKAFLVCRIWQFSYKGPKIAIGSHEAVDALLQQILAKAPNHPAHHYRIHVWDKHKASRAIDSAAQLGFTAPTIAHMWHMPGHIYSQLKRFKDAAWHQQASARIDHAHMMEHRLLPDQIHNYAHNNEWLCRNWINLGDRAAALDMAMSLLSNPRHPKLNSMEGKPKSFRYGRMRLLQILEKFELWEDTLELANTEWLEPLDNPDHDLPRLRLIGLAHYGLEQRDALNDVLSELDELREALQTKHESAKTEAKAKAEKEKKKPEEIEKIVKDAGKKESGQLNRIKSIRSELEGCLAALDGKTDEALKSLEKSGRPRYTLALEHLRLGDKEKADSISKKEVEAHKGETLPLAARILVLHELGKTEEARACFEDLRQISSQIDLAAPPFARLRPIAKEFDLPENWRLPYEVPADFGERPDLSEVGPIHWTPPTAPPFKLPDQNGLPVDLEEYRGKPLILIFYLGYGCLHCTEQLNAIADQIETFNKEGLPVLAVSTDTVPELAKSQANYAKGSNKFPFPLIADPEKNIFKTYGAHDDFENQALHGTFLLDPKGRILWSDISADPFMELDFLIKESHRLLRLHQEKRE